MNIGCVKEVKKYEYRVGLTPQNVADYTTHGHKVYIQSGAGVGSSFSDEEYARCGGIVLADAAEVWRSCEMMVKVKEPLAEEYDFIREGQIIYTYLHLAADRPLTEALLAKKAKAVAYETIRDDSGGLPLLKPMSEVAGRLSIQEGASCLKKTNGGRGVLLGGVPGVPKAEIVIIGGGVVGTNACKVALGMHANVTILDNNLNRLAYLDDIFGQGIQTLYSSPASIETAVQKADLVIGAVLIPGAAAPKLLKREYLKKMKPGSVIVDVAVDQGGCCESTRPTYHDDPTFVVDGVIHYCVANMPGAVSQTSTIALTNATLRQGLLIADNGLEKALALDACLRPGVNCYLGKLTYEGVAVAFDMAYTEIMTALQ